MTKNIELQVRDQRMLELLAAGGSNKALAKRLGYSEGTMRVYLHVLYRKLGVRNKTNAVIWYLGRQRPSAASHPPSALPRPAPAPRETVGDLALRTDLFTALGAMSGFIGAYGHLWEVASRLGGERRSAASEKRRVRARTLWEALLKGDSGYAKQFFDGPWSRSNAEFEPAGGVLLSLLLLLGNHATAAGEVASRLRLARDTRPGAVSASEIVLVHAFDDAVNSRAAEPVASLYQLATGTSANPALRHAAMVALFYAYRSRCDIERARGTANALWGEAEAAREHLHAMGERAPGGDAELPAPASFSRARLAAYLQELPDSKPVLAT